MSEPFIAEVRIFAGNFAPRGWAFCDGQLLSISQNTALFSLIGTIYGGDGRTTTALPDMKGRAPMHPGPGPGLSSRRLGQRFGAETETVTEAEMASHTHAVNMNSAGTERTPINMYPEDGYATDTVNANSGEIVGSSGGSQAHNNLQPYLTLNYIIALLGLYPSRS